MQLASSNIKPHASSQSVPLAYLYVALPGISNLRTKDVLFSIWIEETAKKRICKAPGISCVIKVISISKNPFPAMVLKKASPVAWLGA